MDGWSSTSKEELWQSLCASTKLTRDRSLNTLMELNLSLFPSLDFIKLAPVHRSEDMKTTCWQLKLGFLLTVEALLKQQQYNCCRALGSDSDCFVYVQSTVLPMCLQLMEDESEWRVCLAAASALMGVANCVGVELVFEQSLSTVIKMLRENMEGEENSMDLYGSNSSLASTTSSTASEVLGSTSGRKYMESGLKLIRSLLHLASMQSEKECSHDIEKFKQNFVESGLVALLHESVKHPNRFVREAAFDSMTELIVLNKKKDLKMNRMDEDNLVDDVSRGLADNWSQVRMAASRAGRQLLSNLLTSNDHTSILEVVEEREKNVLMELLPRVCLNRYYVAEGVKLFNQVTWESVVRNKGQTVVQSFLQCFVHYYIECTEAENHAVREAACLCISELTTKMDSSVLRPHLSPLMTALLVCFEDESWPVRDTACVACGNVVKMFPEECMAHKTRLMSLFKTNLRDPIASVREGGAVALSHCLLVWHDAVIEELSNLIQENIEGVKDQPSEHLKDHDGKEGSSASMAKSSDRFENQQMYSCGSLAPKMRRAAHSGCSNASFKKPSEPWEAADGAVHLLAEALRILQARERQHSGVHVQNDQGGVFGRPLCPARTPSQPKVPSLADRHLASLSSACRVRHYPMHLSFLATVLRRLPGMAEALGKRHFKLYLEDFLEPIFYAGRSENNLARDAAQSCLQSLAKLLGPNILEGRVLQMQPPRPAEDLQVLHLALGPQAQILV